MATIASLDIAMSADSAKLKKDLDRANATTKKFADKQKRMFKGTVDGFAKLRAAMVGVAAAAGVKSILNNADAIAKSARAAGMSGEAYQKLAYGLSEAGISANGFEKATVKLSKVITDAGDGSKTAVDALGKIGLQYESLMAMKPEERFYAVMEGLEGIEDAGTRAALASELLGKEFATRQIDTAAVRAAGGDIAVMSDETLAASERVNDAMAKLSQTFTSLVANAIVPLIDGLTPLLETLGTFAAENPEMAAAIAGIVAVSGAFALLGPAITVLMGPVGAVAGLIAAGILVWQNWDEIVRFVTDTFDTYFRPVIEQVKAWINDYIVQPVKDVVEWFDRMIQKIKDIATAIKEATDINFSGFNSVMGNDRPASPGRGGNHATGGFITGPGTTTSDSIPAMLSNGEYVIQAAAVNKFGRAFFDRLNAGMSPIYRASGGAVGTTSAGMIGGDGTTPQVELIIDDEQILPISDSLVSTIQQQMSEALISGDAAGFFTGVMDALTMKIIDTFTQSLADGLFGAIGFDKLFEQFGAWLSSGLTEAMSGIFTGGDGFGAFFKGIGSWIGGIFGFAEGGLVPHTPYSKIGRDSVPAMLTPGEVVVPVDHVQNGFGRGMTTVNLNITGDISRQTRKTIYEMLPDIANGVNAVNYEAGAR